MPPITQTGHILLDWKAVDRVCIQYSYDLDKIIISVVKSVNGNIIKQDFKEEIISESGLLSRRKADLLLHDTGELQW